MEMLMFRLSRRQMIAGLGGTIAGAGLGVAQLCRSARLWTGAGTDTSRRDGRCRRDARGAIGRLRVNVSCVADGS